MSKVSKYEPVSQLASIPSPATVSNGRSSCVLKWASSHVDNCRLINVGRRKAELFLLLNLALLCLFLFSIGHFLDNREQLRHRMDEKFTQIDRLLNQSVPLTSKYLISQANFCQPTTARPSYPGWPSSDRSRDDDRRKRRRATTTSSTADDERPAVDTHNGGKDSFWKCSTSPSNRDHLSLLDRLLIGVVSKTDNFERRVIIRATWGRYARDHGARLLFVVARSRSTLTNQQVQDEQVRYGDMLQMGFDEDYYNLTLKSVALLEYAASHCEQTVQHVLKIDDDVLPNWPLLEKQFCQLKPANTSAYVICTANNYREPIRDPTNKWYTPWDLFPAKRFPAYCSGPAYLLSMAAGKLLLAHLQKSKRVFYLEDVYVTGLLREHEPRVLMVDEPTFLNNNPLYHYCDSRDQLFHHHMNSQTMLLYWPWTVAAKCYRPWYSFAFRWF